MLLKKTLICGILNHSLIVSKNYYLVNIIEMYGYDPLVYPYSWYFGSGA